MLCEEAGVEQFGNRYDGNLTNGYAVLPLVMGRHPDKHPELLQPLQDLLVNHHRSQCKDPRDRVFALLGLITSDERGLLGRFFPDYTMVEDHVLIITLAHLIQFGPLIPEQQHLDAISADSDDLFLGLGVRSKERRALLLRRAAKIDYLDSWSGPDLSRVLASHDLDEVVDLCGYEVISDAPRSRSSRSRTWKILSFVGVMAIYVTVKLLGRWYLE